MTIMLLFWLFCKQFNPLTLCTLIGGLVAFSGFDFSQVFHFKVITNPCWQLCSFWTVFVCAGSFWGCQRLSQTVLFGEEGIILHILSEDLAEFDCLSISWFCLLTMNRLRMTPCVEQLGMTSPFHDCISTTKEDRVRWEEFTSWMAADIRKCTGPCHCPRSEGKTGFLLLTVPLISGYICGSTGKIHWRCLYSCSTFKWWSTVKISSFC